MKVFGYACSKTEYGIHKQDEFLRHCGFNISRNYRDIGWGNTPALERDAMKEMVSKVSKGDIFVMTNVHCLGNEVIEILKTAELFKKKGVKVYIFAD